MVSYIPVGLCVFLCVHPCVQKLNYLHWLVKGVVEKWG